MEATGLKSIIKVYHGINMLLILLAIKAQYNCTTKLGFYSCGFIRMVVFFLVSKSRDE